MSWLYQNDLSQRPLCREYSGTEKLASLMTTGSLVFEFDLSLDGETPARIIHYETFDDWSRCFTLYLNADKSLSLEVIQGPSRTYAALEDVQDLAMGPVRLVYSWNAPARVGTVSLENLETGEIGQVSIGLAPPLPIGDAWEIVCGTSNKIVDDRVSFIGLSDQVVPIGPYGSIRQGANVMTPNGPRPIEKLQVNDLVITQRSGALPIRWIACQEKPELGVTAPVRIRAPFFGLSDDIVVDRRQRILITSSETEYQFGKESVLVEAGKMIAQQAEARHDDLTTANYYQLLFDSHECIKVSDLWVESMFVGRIAESPDIVANTLLKDLPPEIFPLHRKRALPVLRGYECRALVGALIA